MILFETITEIAVYFSTIENGIRVKFVREYVSTLCEKSSRASSRGK